MHVWTYVCKVTACARRVVTLVLEELMKEDMEREKGKVEVPAKELVELVVQVMEVVEAMAAVAAAEEALVIEEDMER